MIENVIYVGPTILGNPGLAYGQTGIIHAGGRTGMIFRPDGAPEEAWAVWKDYIYLSGIDKQLYKGHTWRINPEWAVAEWEIEVPDFTCYNIGPIPKNGPGTDGPITGSVDSSNQDVL